MHPIGAAHALREFAASRLGRVLVALLPLALVILVSSTARAAGVRDAWDRTEMEEMRAQDPQTTALLEKGEDLALSGHLEEARAIFERVKALLPNNSLPRRRYCEVMTALGLGLPALHECYLAMQIRRTHTAERAIVRALVTGPTAPALDRVVEALSLITMDRKRVSSVQLSDALCIIGERIGDGIMLQKCAEELVRIAPTAAETQRALARVQARCPPARFWAGWLAILAASVATAAHALRERMRGGRRSPSPVALAVLLGLAVFAPIGAAQAIELPKADSQLSKWAISDDDPESSIPPEAERNKDPLNFGYWLQDLVFKSERATKRGDKQAAIKLYRAMVKAVPDRAIGYSKLCAAYEAAGERDNAIATCGGALVAEGVTTGDYAAYVRLVLLKPGKLTGKEEENLEGVVKNLVEDPAAHPLSDELECEVASRVGNVKELEQCVAVFVAKAPNEAKTIRYQWALALRHNNVAEARNLVERAKKAGMSEEGLRTMQGAIDGVSHQRRWGMVLAWIAGGLLAVGAGIAASSLLRRRAGRPPEQTAPPAQPPPAESVG